MHHVDDYGPAPLDDPARYPGRWPDGPVLLTGSRVLTLSAWSATAGRLPFLALGSNACPAQIRRKGVRGDVVLTPTRLRHHLVVYAGHVTTYGAVPATVARWHDATCDVFVIWLTPDQQDLLDDSEGGNYRTVTLPTTDGLLPAYRAVTGRLRSADGMPVPLDAVRMTAREMPQPRSQAEALLLAAGRPVR